MLIISCSSWTRLAAQNKPVKTYLITFSKSQTALSMQARQTVDSMAILLKAQPACNLRIGCYFSCARNNKHNSVTWDRANKIIDLLVKNYGFAPQRFYFGYENAPDHFNDIEFTTDYELYGVQTPPHPNFRRKTGDVPCFTNPSIN